MTTGKTWTLKDSKEDQTTPGPVYQTQYLQSVHYKCANTEPKKNSTFGHFRAKQYQVQYKGLERMYLGTESPGPFSYCDNKFPGDLKPVLSVCRTPQKYTFPRKTRMAERKKDDGPNP